MADLWTIAGVAVAAASLIYAGYQTRLSRRATSASVALGVSEAFRTAWRDVYTSDGPAKALAFKELCNLVEAVCTVRKEGLLVGDPASMLEEYLLGVLRTIDGNEDAKKLFAEMMETNRTFDAIRAFIAEMKRKYGADYLALRP